MTGTLQTPTVGSPNSSEDPKIATAVSTLNGLLTSSNLLDGAQLGTGTVPTAALASNAVTTVKITDANVTDAKLASPNNAVYKTLFDLSGLMTNTASTQYFTAGTSLDASPAPGDATVVFYLAGADYTVASLTTKLRVRAQLFAGASVGAFTYTVGLYPVSAVSAGSYTIGAVTAGSTVAFASPAANSLNQGNSGDLTIPSDGYYTLGVASTGAPGATVDLSVQLQIRNV